MVNPKPLPVKLLAAMLPINVLLAAPSCGTIAGSILRVPVEVMVPPTSPDPAVMLVTVPFPVPVPGKFCPGANVIRPLLAIEIPVSAGVAPLEPKRRFKVAEGEAVLLSAASATHWKSCATAELLLLLNDEACKSNGLELNPCDVVAVLVASSCSKPPMSTALPFCVMFEPPIVQGTAVKRAIEFVLAVPSLATVAQGVTA